MQLVALMKKVTSAVLAERDLRIPVHATFPEKAAAFFSSGQGTGYQVKKEGASVVVTRVSRWATLAGLPPLYYFKGALGRSGNEVELIGRVLMVGAAKWFILAWTSAIFVALVVGIALAMYMSAVLMVSKTTSVNDELSFAGFSVGTVMILVAFGVVIIGALRSIKSKELKGLVQFCERLAGSEVKLSENAKYRS